MLSAVKGYYDGNRIVIDEDVKLAIGQKVIVTILENDNNSKEETSIKKDTSFSKPLGLEEISEEKLDNDLKISCQEMLDGKVTSLNEVISEYEPDFKI